MKITITEANGEFYARVNNGDLIVYVTAEYLTERMALADARCWVAFHGKADAMPTYKLAIDPIDTTGGRRALKGEYATKADAWKAVQGTDFSEPVTVLEDGEPVMTFSWQFKTADEPHPTKPNTVRRVRDLCKWTRKGWEVTGVQAVGIGRNRLIRTV
ncbi:hypothetical protein ACQEV9_15580 [Streptomyces chartreusis]|uniref:hypothetical protein n=1 Tax=Streptomyces chartreusis TaxID=1969 RepID=UPI003D923291